MATILIVDDLPVNRRLLETLLSGRGHRLIAVQDGATVLDMVETAVPDLIITDVLMPGMDGYGLMKNLRQNPATERVPVIFYTAHYGARELALKSGAAWFLTNADSAKLVDVVERVLGGEVEDPRKSADSLSEGASA